MLLMTRLKSTYLSNVPRMVTAGYRLEIVGEGNRDSNTDCTRRGIPRTQAPKKICFICNEARDVDSSKYSEGGLSRCEHDRSKETILSCQDYYKSNPTHDYYQASQRLDILLSGTSYDIFSQDVYYHHSCYRHFQKWQNQTRKIKKM